ncbi:MAG: GNAT family N-acetyltransferase [Actinomycetota bacterium]
MSTTVRPAEQSDLNELTALMDTALLELRNQRGGEALASALDRDASSFHTLTSALHAPNTMLWCGLWENVLVGYAIASVISEGDEQVVLITDVYTTPEVRDVGVGELLLESAIAWATGLDAVAIDAYALPGARESKNLFERFGLTARLITVRRQLR